ncbi:MAG: hypothetical protein ACC645_18415 [Pirellulales bacterium]
MIREYRRFVEEGVDGRITSPLKGVVEKVLLGSDEWVKKMRHVLGLAEPDPNVTGLRHLAWRPSQEQIETAVAKDFGVERSRLFASGSRTMTQGSLPCTSFAK